MLSDSGSIVFTVKISDFNSKSSNHEKILWTDWPRDFTNLYRLIGMVYGAKNFTGTTTNDIMLTEIFPGFNWAYNSSNQFNNTSMCIA